VFGRWLFGNCGGLLSLVEVALFGSMAAAVVNYLP